jgi:hypothetical protein
MFVLSPLKKSELKLFNILFITPLIQRKNKNQLCKKKNSQRSLTVLFFG